MVELTDLEKEVLELKEQRDQLKQSKSVLQDKRAQARKHIDIMSAEIFRMLRDEHGRPYNTDNFTLEVGANGEVVVTPAQEQTRKRKDNNNNKKPSRRRQ